MNIIEKAFQKMGFVSTDAMNKVIQTEVQKSWDSIWLRSQENNLIQSGSNVSEPYKDHQTVFMAIDAIADVAPQAKFKVFQGEDGPEIKENHELYDILSRPNPLMCGFQLWEATIVYLKLKGACFWVFEKSIAQEAGTGKIPAEIYVFSPDNFQPVVDKETGRLLRWKYNNKITFELDEVLYFHKFNPFDRIKGNNISEKILRTVNLDYASMLYNSAFFNNSAVPEGFLSTDKSLTDVQYKRLVKEFENRHKGVSRARKVAVLEGGLKWEGGSETHRDMEFLEQRRYNREEILGIWRVPKSLFSITEDLNYATAREQKRIFWENAIIPTLSYIEEQVNEFFIKNIDPNLYGQFDLGGVAALMSDFGEKVDQAHKLWQMGFTGNEINDRLDLGFDDKPWRDHYFVGFGQVPVEQILEGDTAPPPDDEIEEEETPSEEETDESKQLSREDIRRRSLSWDRFDRVTTPLEQKLKSRLKRYFFNIRREVLTELDKNFEDESGKIKDFRGISGFNWDKHEEELSKASKPIVISAVEIGAKNAASDLGVNIDFAVFNPKIVSFVSQRVSKIKRINSSVKTGVSQIVQDAIRTGKTIQETKEELRSFFNFSAKRATTIARTEVVGGSNGGQMLYYQESGVKRKQWVTAKDEKVRPSHKHIDGQIVDMNKNFTNGLDHPGGNGPAEEVINCRCTVLPVIEGE